MAEVLFFIAAIGTIAGAFGVIRLENPFFSVLSLVVHLLMLAALFLLLRAEFVAAAQVVVYAGAVMVLYVFVVAYIGGAEPMRAPFAPGLRVVSVLFVGVILVELWVALLGTGLKAVDTEGAGYEPGFGTPQQLGELLLTRFLLPFELASFLLLIAAVGAVVLARRRRAPGAGDEGRLSVIEALRPAGTGTMREAVSGIPPVAGEPSPGGDRPEVTAGRGSGEGGW